ncbi:maleylpyruvate isomerase family mycothiol-dependent enzyme [Actinacidiphila acidipaludis]|uniref:Maleylpyruvate isomerase family mycothiol-dependent enzyme n=1 Tax=Actinacidiphila acidipaludis TaxID=2873382 RepID=A0ABS7Q0K7_9ACTN|nr:maleylpyruvate isomerase family mycothiol-dependent enzyme [Streptomyces acidipaludis]MBY8876670.1 maleylpyruvate isomerase family mycothiol-dependent enzyme [Streptomyces acidipaludis]
MTVQRPDPERDTAAVADATAELLEAVAALPDDALAEPSLLPGWSRGHVLAHLVGNADGLVNLLTWARTGEETAMYGPGDARERAIEEGAGRSREEHMAALRESGARFTEAVAQLPPAGWAAQVVMRTGRVVAAAEIPWRRLVELRLHHVDLGIGTGCDDLPEDFAARELAWIVDGLTGHEGIAAVRLHDTSAGQKWTIGAAAEPDITVSGGTAALLAWVSGRGDGGGLSVSPDRPLPVLPPLG